MLKGRLELYSEDGMEHQALCFYEEEKEGV